MGGKVVPLFPGHQAHKAVQGIASAAIAAGGTGLCRELSHHIPHDLPQTVTGCHQTVKGVGGVAGGVQLPEGVAKPTVGLCAAFRACLGDLVAHTVQNNTGVAVVLGYHLLNGLLPVLLKVQGIVVGILPQVPYVAQLVHHQHTVPVTGIQQRPPCRVMGGADGVEACFLQLTDAALLGIGQGSCTQNAVVVVDAGTSQLDGLPIDAYPMRCIDAQGTDAKAGLFPVQFFLAL